MSIGLGLWNLALFHAAISIYLLAYLLTCQLSIVRFGSGACFEWDMRWAEGWGCDWGWVVVRVVGCD